jgi:hypothetical protein
VVAGVERAAPVGMKRTRKLEVRRTTLRPLTDSMLGKAGGANAPLPSQQGCTYGLTCTYSNYCSLSACMCPTAGVMCTA